MLVWQEKEELLAPEVFHALTTALRREPRLRFTLTEVNDLPVRQTPMFTLLREAGFSSSPQGLDWGIKLRRDAQFIRQYCRTDYSASGSSDLYLAAVSISCCSSPR